MHVSTRPNLFHHATSELSQDAVLCWLLSWAMPNHRTKNPELHAVGVSLLKLMHERSNASFPEVLTSVEVIRQKDRIDVLCIINDEIAIIVEDKTGSKQHSDQLARYKHHVRDKRGYAPDKILATYIQTGDQSDYSEVKKEGYSVLERCDILQCLESSDGRLARMKSDILEDFALHLRAIEDSVRSYQQLPLDSWTDNSWKGFYAALQLALGQGGWGYVPNPKGGFWGFWWQFAGNDSQQSYLQIEKERLCFKIFVKEASQRRVLREKWHALIVAECSRHGLRVRRPGRFGNGTYMTVAILDQEFRAVDHSGALDMDGTLNTLSMVQGVLRDCEQVPLPCA